MKKHVEKIRKWLGGAAEEHVVRRVAFWWLVSPGREGQATSSRSRPEGRT